MKRIQLTSSQSQSRDLPEFSILESAKFAGMLSPIPVAPTTSKQVSLTHQPTSLTGDKLKKNPASSENCIVTWSKSGDTPIRFLKLVAVS